MNPPVTVRDMIRDIQTEVRDSDLQPGRAAELLAKLTALLGNCLQEIREADHEYAVLLLAYVEKDGVVSRAKIRAETSPEFLRRQEARDARELVIEMVRSLKDVVRMATEEMRLSR